MEFHREHSYSPTLATHHCNTTFLWHKHLDPYIRRTITWVTVFCLPVHNQIDWLIGHSHHGHFPPAIYLMAGKDPRHIGSATGLGWVSGERQILRATYVILPRCITLPATLCRLHRAPYPDMLSTCHHMAYQRTSEYQGGRFQALPLRSALLGWQFS